MSTNPSLVWTHKWLDQKRLILRWTESSHTLMKKTYSQIFKHVKKHLKSSCTHIQGHGGVKQAIRSIQTRLKPNLFFARFDIYNYYRSMNHQVLSRLFQNLDIAKEDIDILHQYIKSAGKQGIPAGGTLSPLLGALYLHPLDCLMDTLEKQGKIRYIRYMDDYVLLAEKRWHLKQALSKMYKLLSQLKLTVHPKKRAIGRVERGIYFLGYTLHPKRKLRPSPQGLERFATRFRRLYEQGASTCMLWNYVLRFTSWLWAGLADLFSFKGGRKRYFIQALVRNQIVERKPLRSGFP